MTSLHYLRPLGKAREDGGGEEGDIEAGEWGGVGKGQAGTGRGTYRQENGVGRGQAGVWGYEGTDRSRGTGRRHAGV